MSTRISKISLLSNSFSWNILSFLTTQSSFTPITIIIFPSSSWWFLWDFPFQFLSSFCEFYCWWFPHSTLSSNKSHKQWLPVQIRCSVWSFEIIIFSLPGYQSPVSSYCPWFLSVNFPHSYSGSCLSSWLSVPLLFLHWFHKAINKMSESQPSSSPPGPCNLGPPSIFAWQSKELKTDSQKINCKEKFNFSFLFSRLIDWL